MPTNKDLANEVIPKVCPMWREVGVQLNLDVAILNEIEANCRGDVRECCTKMFQIWLIWDTEASWITVIDACKRVRQNLLESPDQPHTKNHIEALNLLCITLPEFLKNL